MRNFGKSIGSKDWVTETLLLKDLSDFFLRTRLRAGVCGKSPLPKAGRDLLGDGEQSAWNCYNLGESNCLIETKLRDG